MDKTRRGNLFSLSIILIIFLLSCSSSQNEVVIAFTQETEGIYTAQITQTPSPMPNLKPTATATGPKWQYLGGPRGGIGYDIRIHPDNKNYMWVTDANVGVQRSEDAGKTWSASNQGIDSRSGTSNDSVPIFTLAVSPINPDVVWAGAKGMLGLYKSEDGGLTWVAHENGIIEKDDMEFRGISFDPSDPDTIYCGGNYFANWTIENQGNAQRGFIYKSVDAGETWNLLIEPGALVRWIIVDPTNSNIIYASTGIFDRMAVKAEGILKSTDGGETWFQINNGLYPLVINALAMHPNDPQTLLAGTGGQSLFFSNDPNNRISGVFITHDGGEAWKRVDPLIGGEDWVGIFSTVAFSPSDPDTLYADAGSLFLRSDNGGVSWKTFNVENDPNKGIYDYRGIPIALAIDSDNPDVIYMNAYAGGVMISSDGGETWKDTSTGYSGEIVFGLAVDSDNPAHIFSASKTGVHVSFDGGEHWGARNGMRGFWHFSAIEINPRNPDVIIGGTIIDGRLFRSEDGGSYWKAVLGPVGEESSTGRRTVYDIEYSPSTDTVYAATGISAIEGNVERGTLGSGLYRSVDGGISWQQVHSGLEDTTQSFFDIAIDPINASILYVSTMDDGVFKSVNSGDEWFPINNGLGPKWIRAIAIDSLNPETIYAGAEQAGVWKSMNGGENWTLASNGMPAEATITSIVVSPTDSNIIFASDLSSGVYTSADGGETWYAVNAGLDVRAIHELAISGDGQHLYAATNGKGVFRIDLDGNIPSPYDDSNK